jgi:hypothetical protein
VTKLSRLKQPKKRGEQLRLLPASEMPKDAIPLENDTVERIRAALAKMGYLTWSGRVAIYDPTPEARAERAARGWPPFIPALEPGCPDILGVFPGGAGRFFGIETKRAETDKERASQIAWRERATAWGIFSVVARSVEEAIAALDAEHRKVGKDRSPPWVLFIDQDKPVAILPAGRPGEVARVSHLTMERAQEIVAIANRFHHELVVTRLEQLGAEITTLAAELGVDLGAGTTTG